MPKIDNAMIPPEMEDQVRCICYDFGDAFLDLTTIGTTLTFSIGDNEVPGFRMIERHYFRDQLIKSYDFEFGFGIPNSTNTCAPGARTARRRTGRSNREAPYRALEPRGAVPVLHSPLGRSSSASGRSSSASRPLQQCLSAALAAPAWSAPASRPSADQALRARDETLSAGGRPSTRCPSSVRRPSRR